MNFPTSPARLPEVAEVFETMAVIARHPASSLGAYIISMATAPSDVLAVYLVAAVGRCARTDESRPAVRNALRPQRRRRSD